MLLVVETFQDSSKEWGKKKNNVVVAEKRLQAESFEQNLQNKPVGGEETFQETFPINHVE